MSELATLMPNNTLELPLEVAKHFKPADRFVVWVDGETVLLRRITPSPLKIVENADEDEPLTLDELDDIVHKVRDLRPTTPE